MTENGKEYERFGVTFASSALDNCGVYASIHVSDHEWDGGSYLLFEANGHITQPEEDDHTTIVDGQKLQITVDLEELKDFHAMLTKALAYYEASGLA